ncbi:hypothetical protein OJAV_G00231330 [Oryzias javanicus]|uniref:RAD51 interacting motif domain-containing protein n=1 Tax=Oryzias javanicus TaxID=123683 RepID=A0A3S2PMR3_ORYJA|nr:hypothetical protein OJAV_G00231330 [Oryzias javanicus]
MKEITEAFGSEAERKFSSPLSAKWPRIDSEDLSVNSRADSPLKAKHLTPVDLQKSGGLTWESEFEDSHTKACDETVTVAYALHTSAAHSNISHTGSSQRSFIISEEHQAPMRRTEHLLVPDTDKFKFSPRDYSGRAPTSVNTYSPSSPVHKQQRKSLECASPGSCSFLTGSDEEGTQVQTSIGQTLALALSSGRLDCTNDAVYVEGLCETWSQFAEVEEGNLEKKEHDFIENIPSTAVVSKPEEAVFGNLTEGEEKNKESEMWICISEYPLTCGAETQVHESDVRETIIFSPDIRVEGSILVDVGKKSIDEKVCADVNNHDEALNATDPAIKVEIVNSFEWMHTYSGSTTDLLCYDSNILQRVQESPEQSDWLCTEANEASCQSIAQTQGYLITNSSSLNMNGNQGNCQPHFSPSVTPGGIQQSEDLSPNATEKQTEEKAKKAEMSKEKLPSPSQQDRCITNQMEGETVKDAGELGKNHDLLCPQPASSDVYASDMSEEKEVVIDATEEIKAVGCKRSEMSANNNTLMPADSISSVCNASKQEQRLDISCDGQHRSKVVSAEGGDQLLASDAVVPCQLDLSPLQNRHPSSTALPHHDRCSSLSLSFCSRALGGFDTFEKVHLSLDDEDDACLIYVPPQPLKATPPLLPYELVDEGACPEDLLIKNLSKEEVKILKVTASDCNSFINDEALQIISAPEKPKLQPDGGSACESSQSKMLPTESDTPSSINKSPCTDFDMTEHFSKVLKELNLFFDISCSDFAQPPSPDQYVTDPVESSVLEPTQYLRSPEPDDFRATSTGEDAGVKICEHDSVNAVSSDTEQEVPLNTHLCRKVSPDAPEKPTEPEEIKQKTWSSSFMYPPFSEQASHSSSESPRRLEPLKTCTRPIRVGLSKRAKTKHLHRLHPY